MMQKSTYEMTLKLRREGLLPVPVADVCARGTFDPGKEFAGQLLETIGQQLARMRPDLEKARRG